jgi:ArsR family transcriptional regulator, arsenate/arsenite/antimonite-responsive transcriptional repressor
MFLVDALTVTPEPESCCTPLLQFALDDEQAAELAEVLKALADPVRLRLVSIIGTAEAGEVCACDLPALVDRTQPTVSHHLSMLVKVGCSNESSAASGPGSASAGSGSHRSATRW